MKHRHLTWLFLCTLFCTEGTSALAQDEVVDSEDHVAVIQDEVVDSKDESSSGWKHDGGFVSVKLGGHIGYERVGTHTEYGFYTPENGYSFALEAGYNKNSGFVSGVIKARSGWALKDKVYHHYVNNDPNQRYSYNAINKGEWDGYFMTIGARGGGFIDISEDHKWKLALSGGFDIPIGYSMDRETVYASFLFVFSVGFQYFFTSSLSIGASLDLSGIAAFGPSDPGDEYFNSLNQEESLQGDPRYIYLEPSVTLHYYF